MYFKSGDLMEIDQIKSKILDGENNIKNRQLLHKRCHDEQIVKYSSLHCLHD